jgi:hypothetical protein
MFSNLVMTGSCMHRSIGFSCMQYIRKSFQVQFRRRGESYAVEVCWLRNLKCGFVLVPTSSYKALTLLAPMLQSGKNLQSSILTVLKILTQEMRSYVRQGTSLAGVGSFHFLCM